MARKDTVHTQDVEIVMEKVNYDRLNLIRTNTIYILVKNFIFTLKIISFYIYLKSNVQ